MNRRKQGGEGQTDRKKKHKRYKGHKKGREGRNQKSMRKASGLLRFGRSAREKKRPHIKKLAAVMQDFNRYGVLFVNRFVENRLSDGLRRRQRPGTPIKLPARRENYPPRFPPARRGLRRMPPNRICHETNHSAGGRCLVGNSVECPRVGIEIRCQLGAGRGTGRKGAYPR